MTAATDITKRIEPDIQKVHFYIAENLKSHVPLISEINQHILLSGGKRLRALLFILYRPGIAFVPYRQPLPSR